MGRIAQQRDPAQAPALERVAVAHQVFVEDRGPAHQGGDVNPALKRQRARCGGLASSRPVNSVLAAGWSVEPSPSLAQTTQLVSERPRSASRVG